MKNGKPLDPTPKIAGSYAPGGVTPPDDRHGAPNRMGGATTPPGADGPITADKPNGFGKHAWPTDGKPGTLTLRNGAPVGSNEHSLTAGPNGPALVEDAWLLEKNAHFNRERVPERVVHAKGAAAFGYFELEHDMSQYTKAKLFNGDRTKTEVAVRFSHVIAESGGADAYRDVRGFSIKFHTTEGNWDLVGNNTPVFFLRDAMKFPDLIHALKRDPQTHLRDNAKQWDFWTLSPESIHQVLWLMGDRGIPAGYEYMNGYGSHTFMWYNEANEKFWVKFHFHSEQGVKTLSDAAAGQIRADEGKLDSFTQSLFNRIDAGETTAWKLSVQIMPFDEAFTYKYDPFDVTKVLLHADFPLIPVGRLVLDRNPTNYAAEVEALAFAPSNLVPGIHVSPDKVLQGRLFGYQDAQRYRLGGNHHLLHVNAPHGTKVDNPYERDGGMAVGGNNGARVNYAPNSHGGPVADPKYIEPALALRDATGRYAQTDRRNDDYSQATLLYKTMGPDGQQRLMRTIATHMQTVPPPIRKRAVAMFEKVDAAFGKRMAELLLDDHKEASTCGVEPTELAAKLIAT
ncbi:MAG: catalase KatA [Vulcanimicrobiaceae bacterium]